MFGWLKAPNNPVSDEELSFSEFSDEELNRAAMHKICDKFHNITQLDAQWGTTSEEALDRAEEIAKKYEEWVRTLPDRRVRRAFQGWINYYRYNYREARAELKTHAARDRSKALWEDYKRRDERARQVKLPDPPP